MCFYVSVKYFFSTAIQVEDIVIVYEILHITVVWFKFLESWSANKKELKETKTPHSENKKQNGHTLGILSKCEILVKISS